MNAKLLACSLLFIAVLPSIGLALTVEEARESTERVLEQTCQVRAETAGAVMDLRQRGVSAVEIMQKLQSTGVEREILSLYGGFIEEAYTSPRYQSKGLQDQAVKEFESKIYVSCRKLLMAALRKASETSK